MCNKYVFIIDKSTFFVYNLHMKTQNIIKKLNSNGWHKVRQSGSHAIFKNDQTNQTVPLPIKKDVKIGTLKSIERITGIKF